MSKSVMKRLAVQMTDEVDERAARAAEVAAREAGLAAARAIAATVEGTSERRAALLAEWAQRPGVGLWVGLGLRRIARELDPFAGL